jgi:hypothetical protein
MPRPPSYRNIDIDGQAARVAAITAEMKKSTWQLRQDARACVCIYCAGVLANIDAMVKGYASHCGNKKQARYNYFYFIRRLREIRTSPFQKHTEK